MIEVVKRGSDGLVRDHPFWGMPCINLGVSFLKPTRDENGRQNLNAIRYVWALLDTGADLNLISENLIPDGAAVLEMINNNGVTGAAPSRNYAVTLHIREADAFHQTGCISMPYREYRGYDMILGRKFLQCTRFTYDLHHGIREIEWLHNPDAI